MTSKIALATMTAVGPMMGAAFAGDNVLVDIFGDQNVKRSIRSAGMRVP